MKHSSSRHRTKPEVVGSSMGGAMKKRRETEGVSGLPYERSPLVANAPPDIKSDRRPPCYPNYNPSNAFCRLECWWSRSCCNQSAVGGISVPRRNDQYPRGYEEGKR